MFGCHGDKNALSARFVPTRVLQLLIFRLPENDWNVVRWDIDLFIFKCLDLIPVIIFVSNRRIRCSVGLHASPLRLHAATYPLPLHHHSAYRPPARCHHSTTTPQPLCLHTAYNDKIFAVYLGSLYIKSIRNTACRHTHTQNIN